MKKLISLFLCMCIILFGCASTQNPEAPSTSETSAETNQPSEVDTPTEPTENTKETTPPTEEATQPEPLAVTVEERVVYEDDDVKVTLKGFDDSDRHDVKIKFLVENYTDRNIALSGNHFVINGISMWANLYVKVAAGMKANDYLEIDKEDLAFVGIENIATICAKDTRIIDTDSYDTLLDIAFDIETSISEGYVQEIDESGDLVLDQDGIVIKYRGIARNDYGDDELWFFVENSTDQDVHVSVENVSVNGFTVYGSFLAYAYSGSVCYESMDFSSNDLEENSIDGIESVSFTFKVYEQETYDTIFESDIIEVTSEIVETSDDDSDGSNISLGNFTFTIPGNFEIEDSSENSFVISSADGVCAFGFSAIDISALDEDGARTFLPLSHETFLCDDKYRTNEDTVNGTVCDFSVDMDYYLDSGNDSVNMVGTFTDSWYSYTIIFICEDGNVLLDDYVNLFAEFAVFAEHNGTEPRFDFVQ